VEKIIITGTKGFIGQNLLNELKDKFEILEINDRIQNEITKNNSSTTAISSNQLRFHNLNGNYNTVSVSNFSNNFNPECNLFLKCRLGIFIRKKFY